MTNYTVLLDACVMYPAPCAVKKLFDVLYLSNSGLFRARWSNMIHDEWIRNVLKNNTSLTPEKLERVKSLMNAHVPDCLIEGYEPLISRVSTTRSR